MATRKEIAQNQKILYDDAVANNMFQAAVPTFKEFQKRLEGHGYQKMVYDNYKKHNVKGKGFNNLNEFRGAFGGSFYADENKIGVLGRAAAISSSANNTVRQAKRNIQTKLGQSKKFDGGRVTTRLKNPLQNQNVQKNEFNYNATTGKTGTYTTTDGVEFDNEYDAAQYQDKLDKYGEEWSNAVDMGIVPSELDKVDPDLSATDVAMRQMERRQKWLNENQNRRSKELNESMHLQGSPFVASGGAVAPSSFNTAISNEANRLSDVEYGAYNTAKAYNQMLRTTLLQELKEQRQRNENAGWWKDKWNDVSNYFGAMFNTMLDPKLYSQGVMDAAISNNLLQVKKGMEDGTIKKGSNAGNAVQAMLGAIQQQQGEAAKQQQYGTKAYQYGDMSGRSFKFMADFGLSGWRNVMTTGFTKAGEKVGEKMALGALGKWFTKNTGRVLGDMAGSAALAATNQLGSTYNNVIERYVGMNNENGGVTQDKNGDLKFNEGVSLGKAIKDGFGSATIENFSEMFGEYLPGAPKLLSKLGLSKVSSFFEKIGNNAYYKWLSNATNKSGIQGVMAEISEEEFGTALHAAWGDGDGSWSDFNVFTNPDAREKQIDTCLGMFYSVGFMQAPRTAVGAINAVQYFNIKHQVDKADKFGQVMFNDKWDEIKSKIDVTTNADLTKTVLDATRSDSMTAKQKGAVINYAMFLSKLRGFNQASDAKTKDKVEEGDTAPTLSNDLDDAYTEGHNADDTDKHNIQFQQEDHMRTLASALGISEQQLSAMSDDELESLKGQDDKLDQAIYDYQLSSARYQGVVDDAQDKVDLAAHQAEQRVDMYTDQSRGSVRNATIKASGGLEDYGVYIISGNIATHDDGSIDVSNSDDMILYYDPTTNSVEHADALMFAELGEELPADDVKAQAVADAKENAIKEVAGIIDGTVEVGSQFNVTGADGMEHTYEVLADYGDGTASISIDGKVVENPYQLADLQQMKDLEDQKRLEAAKAEREQMEKERAAQQSQETEETQPSFDFNQILNDNGNVVLADVLGNDGNTKYPNSQLFLIRDSGAKAKVVELKSDGTLVPHAVNKKDVRTATTMTLDEYKQAFAESSMIEDNSGENRGEIEIETPTIDSETAAPTDMVAATESSETSATEQTPAAPAMTLEDGTIVPMLEDGNPDFSKLTASQTAELYDTQFGDDAESVISSWVSDAKKALDKASNMTVKGKNFVEQKAAKDAKEKAIADAQAAYDSAIAIRDAYNERQLAKVEDTPEGRRNLIEKARRKFSRLKSAVKDDAEAVSQLYRDTVGSLMHRLYDSTGIDVTDTVPLTAEEYVASNLGAHSLNYEGTETSKGVKQETGLNREDFAKTQLLAADGKGTTIDALIHSLWENRPSNLESLDTQDIRNALIGVLTSGFKASEARNFVENIRIAQAENILEEQKRAQENADYAEQQKAEQEAELEAKSDEKAESEAKSKAKLDNESSNESNDLNNDLDNEKTNDKINDNINVPDDATDENPLGAQRDESDLPFSAKENGKQQTTAERDADVEKNKVDDMKVVDNIIGQKTRKTLEKLAKMMGANVQWQYSDKNANGWFDDKTNTIYLTLDSSITEGVQFIFGHEMTHEMRTKNPAAYDELKTIVKDMMGEDAFNSETDRITSLYNENNVFYNGGRTAYEEEVVADQLGKWIRDANYAHTLLLKMSHPLLAKLHEIVNRFLMALHGIEISDDMNLILRSIEQAYVKTANGQVTNSETGEDVSFSLRQKPEPKKKGIGYKVFVLKDGKLYPPMVANPDGAATPVGVWLDADAAPIAGESKTGRPLVKQGGKGTQGGSGKLAYRPGWHLGVVPYAIQFNRKDADGNKTLFPKNFVFAEVEYAADVDYQEEARQEGINPSGKYQHSLAGLKHLPTDGFYMYRTNPNPETDPWVITGAMKVNRILTRAEQAELVKNAGREPQQIQDGDIVTDDVVNSINQEIADAPKFSLKVYHGSGADFSEFDFDHMGEGAGSQVFGWGGYVTSSKKIGKDYAAVGQQSAESRHAYSEDTPIEAAVSAILGQYMYNNQAKTFEQKKAQAIKNAENSITSFSDMLKNSNELDEKGKKFLQKSIENDKKKLELLRTLTKEQYKEEYIKQGRAKNLYEVDIPEDNGSNYMDWDKPLSKKQQDSIREGLEHLGVDIKTLESKGQSLERTGENVYNSTLYIGLTGTEYDFPEKTKGISKFLSSVGFTGIKYKAGRNFGGAKKGDTNYVIFKPEDMRITEHTKFSIKTYHGSQASFDKFDHSFMGSGEGAQAYGWGTYVSEVEGIAKAYAKSNATIHSDNGYKEALYKYREADFNYHITETSYKNAVKNLKEKEQLAHPKIKNLEKELEEAKSSGDTISIGFLETALKNWNKVLQTARKEVSKYEDTILPNDKDLLEKAKKRMEELMPERNLYSVDIPDDTGRNYIGWDEEYRDKELYSMLDKIGKALESNGIDLDKEYNETASWNDWVERLKDEGEDWKPNVATGQSIYNKLSSMLGENAYQGNQKAASLVLKDAGFVGVKVVAQRNTGGNKEGKMNYVIFDENNAKITSHTKFSLKSKPVRFEAGKKLSDEEKKEVLSTLKDAYKVNGVPYHIEETAGGKEKRVYEPTADSYVVSDITNRPLRYYITLPDGRVAHPTEVYPNISDNEVKSSANKQGLLDDEADKIVSAAIGNMNDIADNAKAIEVLTELQNLPHETHDVGYGMNNAQSYNYKTGIFTSDAAQAIDYVVRRMRRKEDVPAEIPASLKKAVADSYGMVDNLIDGMSSTKFSLKDEKTLVGVHNITEEKLRKALKLGGFANPSLAVIDTNKNVHDNFGEISFIAPSALLDKRTGNTAGTWITDAYTQRYPSVEREMSEKGSQKFRDWVDSLEYPSEAKAEIKRQAEDALSNNNAPAWELMYLKEKGIDIKEYDSRIDYRWKEIIKEHPTAEDILSSMQNDTELNEKVTGLAKHIIVDPIRGKISLEVRRKIYEETGVKMSSLNPQVRKQTKEIFERDYKPTLLDEYGNPKKEDIKKVVEDIVKEHNDTKKYDFYLSKVKASNYVNKNGLYDDYIRWQENKLDEFGTKNRIFRGYNNDGTRKYVPETLENVSKAMREDSNGQTNGSEYTSFGSFIAKLASRVDSTDEMRANKDKLSSNEDKEEFYDKWSDVYYELAKFLYNDVFYGEQRLHDIVSHADPKKYAKKEYGITLTPTFMKKLDALKNAVQTELKSAYFETKYNRPLRLNEFAAAVVPDNLGEDVRKGIENAGLPMYNYDPNKEGDRSRAFNEAINSSDNIRFSLKEEKENIVADAKANGTYMTAPNGEKTKLNAEQWATVRTTNFKNWFGDWENDPDNASKVVDENGEPMVVWHGRSAEFNTFEKKEGVRFIMGLEDKVKAEGFFFSPDKGLAEEFASNSSRHRGGKANVVPCFLNIRKPMDLTGEDYDRIYEDVTGWEYMVGMDTQDNLWGIMDEEGMADKIKEKGYDGAIFVEEVDDSYEPTKISYCALDANQIKSADNNNGDFSADNNDIRFSLAGERGAATADKAEERTTRMDFLFVARKMEEEKKDAKAIKIATGWERGADGKWRFEIPDFHFNYEKWKDNNKEILDSMDDKDYRNVMRYEKEFYEDLSPIRKKNFDELRSRTGYKIKQELTLGDVLEGKGADNLFKYYPELRGVKFKFSNLGAYTFGTYNNKTKTIEVNDALLYSPRKAERNLQHEVQHVIQHLEGFAKGGNEFQVRGEVKKKFSEVIKQIRQLRAEGKEDEAKAIVEKNRGLYNAYTKNDDYNSYKSLAGEVEARNVQERMNMTSEERRKTLAESTEDVARKDQIFLGVGDVSFSLRDMADGKESGADDMAEDLKSLNTPDEVDDAIKTAIDDMPSGWQMANKNIIHIAQALGENRKAEIAGEEPKFSIRTYHGTGASFDKFDLSHAFEGEGSETFGHGVYVTNSSKIGREYAQRAKQRKMADLYKNMRYPDGVKGDIFKRRVFGEMVNDVATGGSVASAKEFAKKRVGADANDIQRTLENLKDREKGTEYEQNLKDRLAEYKEGLKWIDSLDEDYLTQGNANRYDVDIPDDNGSNYLDWEGTIPDSLDKQKVAEDSYKVVSDNQGFKDSKVTPLNDFIAHTLKTYVDTTDVAASVEKLKSDINDVIEDDLADDDVLSLNEYLKDATTDDVLATIWYNDLVRDIDNSETGEELYRKLSTYVGDNAASEILADNGFVGIKYPAGMIHGGAEEGDYNYVIFDENNANIVGNTRFSLRYDKFEHDLNQWKKDNNLPKDAKRPTIPQRNAGESAVDFLRRVDEYRKQMALWKTAPTYEQHLLSDDTALGEFNRELQRGSVLKRIAFQDSMLAIRKAQEAIMKEVGVDRLNMAEDAYTAENRSHGKGKNEFEEYNNEFLQPLRKAYHQMKKVLGDSYDNVRIYMMAKHGLERDAQMAFKMSLDADYEDVAQRSAAYKAYKGDMNRIINDSDLEFGRVDFTTWRQRDNALRAKYSPSYMNYRYDKNGIVYDYSGLSALFDGSDFEEAAYKLVKDIEDKYVTETHNLWDATNAATKKILRDGYKAGMMSKDTYQYVRDMYSHYIPLRGWDGTTADQVWDYVGGGKGAFNQTLKTAHGRTSIADDPIAYIENMAESGILLNNKNWVKQHLMLLAQNHPTSLLTLSKAWYVKSTDANGNEEWIPATPQITSQMNSNQVKAAIDAFEKKMEQMAQTGDATQKRDGLNIAYPQTHSEEREHEVRVMKDGEEYVIYVNGDPQLAQAMNNTRAHRVREIQSGKLDRAAAWLGRKMAAAYTSLSPLFIPSNYFRDLTMTLASTAIREDAKYNYLLRKNLATSWNLGFMLRDYQNGKLRDKVNNGNATPKEQMFYDFMMNGGETGFVSSLDVEDLKKKFKNDLKDLDRWKANPVKVGHTIMDSIEFLNRAIEDSNRFAVYMTSIQYGRSIDEAVNDAKDVTLNFNRKGTGEYGWQMIRNLYLFINPAVQSLHTLGALAKHHPFKFTAVTASWLASGVLVPIVNAALMQMAAAFLGGDGDDDKDWYKDISKKYWQFSKWDRRNNFIMWVPFTHEFIKIPLAQEFRAFYGVGDMIASKMIGGELAEQSWEDYGWDLLGQVVDMLPLDPTGYDGNIAVSLMPNPIRPVFELAFNVDFTGKPLFKETEYNKYDPNFTKAYVGTPDWLVRASRMVNSIGNDYPDVQQNSIDAFGDPRYNLNNPAVVDHVLSSYLGGAYTMGSQMLGLLTKSLNDPKEIKVADIPLFSKFVSNPDDRPVTKKQGDEFWSMKENHDRAANTLSKLKKQAKVDGDYSMLERFYGSEEYKQYKQDDVKVKKYEEDKKKERAEESGEEYRPHKLNAEDIYKSHATPNDDFEDLKLKQLYTKLNGFKTSYDLLVDTAPSQSDGYYNTNKVAIDAIDEISLDKQEISELKKGFLDDGKDSYNAEDMKRIRELRKKILAVLEKANKVVVANQKANTDK